MTPVCLLAHPDCLQSCNGKAAIFAAFGADKALLEEFLTFWAHQSRQQDEHHSDVPEAVPVNDPDRRTRSPTFQVSIVL
ncbi:hypothetical protein FRC08_000127 [Ceratobasidium sp. 394]|nr:hypothetical protein FRC08_000127 [Ceratobasidium sp. 394]KAG9101254.1 hypothetical protein FS749_008703 [Ceratobasidium sp. UAMH 11750]